MLFHFRKFEDIGDISGKRVLLLSDLNETFENGTFKDDFRISKAVQTVSVLLDKGAKVLIISHFGSEENLSLEPVTSYLNNFFPTIFAKTLEEAESLLSKGDTNAVLLENIRTFSGEVENDGIFSKKLASLGDIFVNEGFSVSHRNHASVVGISKFIPAFSGLNFEKEIDHLSMVFNPLRPFILVLGGKKTETKLPLISKFIDSVDKIFIGGVLANDFLKAKGFEIGDSLHSKENLIKEDWLNSEKIVLPDDFTVSFGDKIVRGVLLKEIREGQKIMDVGESFSNKLKNDLKNTGLVIFNGSLGFFEGGFENGTANVGRVIAESGARSIVGGGDTVSAISKLNMMRDFSFVSTGGGAMLDFLCDGELPGITALQENRDKFKN